ncbi:hypothetical protein AGOR_G00022910 [Albula goreensis]|uniref:BZIP domain-containing protein n=1 Tax=Albula goreensis TaxID=1534307 RepID=A0A8T3E4W4_9TELE|nr:hypothetical protein AGOR_G00022910 [Albula goreensis]
MPQPSISGMYPSFGDAFQNHAFADQVLTSTDLLASSSDPDFMYELDRDMTCRQSPRADVFTLGECREMDSMEQQQVMELLDGEPTYSSTFEQWDSYWEDLTRYTKLTSCDIWGTKEVDFLGLDDFSSPYQDEEVISRTPTLAQLNGEDSQPVSDTLYHPDLLLSQKPHPSPGPASSSSHGKKAPGRLLGACACSSSSSRNPLPDFAEGSQKATWPVASSTETMSKAQATSKGSKLMSPPSSDSKDYVRKASVRLSVPRQAVPMSTFVEGPTTTDSTTIVATAVTKATSAVIGEKKTDRPRLLEAPALETAFPPSVSHKLFIGTGGNHTLGPTGPLDPDSSQDKKEEEHNYSLFLTQGKLAGKEEAHIKAEEEEEEEDEEDEEEEAELDDEGFGSEHELSENEEEEEEEDEEEDEDYEGDKDDDMSDTFSEPGCDNDNMEDVKSLTAGISRKRGKRRYFWEYSEQVPSSKQERMLLPSEWDRETLPSNMYQKGGLHHGKYAVKKSRRTDVEDLTPNPRKLLQIGSELRKLNKVISDLTPVSELPLTARPRSRKEKNKLASRACRLKKKAQYEANKVKLWGLNTEYDRLLFVINAIKEEIVSRLQNVATDKATSMADKLDRLIKETLVTSPVAGQTSDFVNQILEVTSRGDPTGGLVGLRVPTSKV